MELVMGRRGSGRTTDMIQWLRNGRNDLKADEVRVLVCHSEAEAMRLYRSTFDDDDQSDLYSWQFVSVAELQRPDALHGVTRFAKQRIVLGIDNLELVLAALFRHPVSRMALTADECTMVQL